MNCLFVSSAAVACFAAVLGTYHYVRHVLFKPTRDRPIPIKNWSSEVDFSPFSSNARRPYTLEEVYLIVSEATSAGTPLKVVGSGHTWTDMALPLNSTGLMISLDRMSRVVSVDKGRMLVSVQAGLRVHDFYDALAAEGLALTNVPSVDEQSVGGVIATASHGAGVTTSSLSAAVHRVQLVTSRPGAPAVWLSANDGELYEAARAHLGALGIVTEVVFRVVPAFRLQTKEYLMSSTKFYDRWQQPTGHQLQFTRGSEASSNVSHVFSGNGMGALTAAHEFAKFWVIPYTDHTLVHAIDRVRLPVLTGSGPVPSSDGLPSLEPSVSAIEELNRYGTELLNLVGPGQPMQPTVNEIAARLGFASPREREGRSDRLQVIQARVPYHTETEYSVPARFAGRAMMEFAGASAGVGTKSGFVHELRYVASDPVPLSPDYSASYKLVLEDALLAALGGTSADREVSLRAAWKAIDEQGAQAVQHVPGLWEALAGDVSMHPALSRANQPRLHVTLGLFGATDAQKREYFGLFEEICRKYEGRPHWAKHFYRTAKTGLEEQWHGSDGIAGLRRAAASLDPAGLFLNRWLLDRLWKDI